MKYNFTQYYRFRKITFILHYELWNKDSEWKEVRLYCLLWEFNFSVKNKNYGKKEK